jgi:hypothetical protein
MHEDTTYHGSPAVGGWLVIGLSAVLVLLVVLTRKHEPLATFTVEFVSIAAASAGLMYGGYRLATSDYAPDELWRVVRWCFLGTVTASVLVGWMLLYEELAGSDLVGTIVLLASMAVGGGIAGLTLGVHDVDKRRPSAVEPTDRPDTEDDPSPPIERVSEAGLTQNDKGRSVGSARELAVLEYLTAHDEAPVTLEALASAITAHEASSESAVADDFETRTRVAIALHHNTLPRLDDRGEFPLHYDPVRRLVFTGSEGTRR